MIPKPSNYTTMALCALKRLCLSSWDAGQFEALKAQLEISAKRHLDLNLAPRKQPTDWKQSTLEIVAKFPELEKYEDAWPLYPIFDRLRRKTIWPKRSTHRKSRKKVRSPSPQASSLHEQSTPARVYAGKRLPRHRIFVTGSPANDPPIRLENEHLERSPACRPEELFTPQLSSQTLSSSMTYNRGQINMSEAGTPCLQSNYRVETFPVACILCGHVPAVSCAEKQQINAIPVLTDTISSLLAMLGILTDRHLYIWLKWGNQGDLLKSLPQYTLNPIHRLLLLKHLTELKRFTETMQSTQNLAATSSVSRTTLRDHFLQPSLESEKYITSHRSPSNALIAAMGLEDDQRAYGRFIDTLNQAMQEEWPTSVSSSSQGDSEQPSRWTSLVNKVCTKHPMIKRYENSWPIKFYVQRRRESLRAMRNSDPVEILPDPLSVPSLGGAAWSGCLIHGRRQPSVNDISPKLQVLLKSFGMQELMPLFAVIPMATDELYDGFCQLKVEERFSLLMSGLELCKMKPFQEMMLKVILKSLDV